MSAARNKSSRTESLSKELSEKAVFGKRGVSLTHRSPSVAPRISGQSQGDGGPTGAQKETEGTVTDIGDGPGLLKSIELMFQSGLGNIRTDIGQDLMGLSSRVESLVDGLDSKITLLNDDLESLRRRVVKDSEDVEQRLKALEHGPPQSSSKTSGEETNYWAARSNLILCPILGPNLEEFLKCFLSWDWRVI